MIGIHKCGQGWEYCDGNCATCAVNHCTTTTGTNAQVTIKKDYPPCLDHPKERKKQTNADRIRAMTDNELAQEIWSCHVFASFADLLDWLKKEAEEGE